MPTDTTFTNLAVTGTLAVTGATTQTGDFAVSGNSAVTGKNTWSNYVIAEGATMVVGAEAGNAINVTIQLTDGAGADLANAAEIGFYLSTDSAGNVRATTAPDGGIAIGTDGLIVPNNAGLDGRMVSEEDGDIDINITEAGAGTWYLVLTLPTGKRVVSGAITFV